MRSSAMTTAVKQKCLQLSLKTKF